MAAIESRLTRLARQVEKDRAKAAQTEDQLYLLISEAHHDYGLPMSRIAELTGLSKTRIVEIANGRARRS